VTHNPWFFRIGYAVPAVMILIVELCAIFNEVSGDTITENVRSIIGIAPFFWYTTLGFYAGLTLWMTRHFWWRKK